MHHESWLAALEVSLLVTTALCSPPKRNSLTQRCKQNDFFDFEVVLHILWMHLLDTNSMDMARFMATIKEKPPPLDMIAKTSKNARKIQWMDKQCIMEQAANSEHWQHTMVMFIGRKYSLMVVSTEALMQTLMFKFRSVSERGDRAPTFHSFPRYS